MPAIGRTPSTVQKKPFAGQPNQQPAMSFTAGIHITISYSLLNQYTEIRGSMKIHRDNMVKPQLTYLWVPGPWIEIGV